jgi:hypothetical protein
MVNPVIYKLNTENGSREITIEPVYEEITGGDLFATGRYVLTESGAGIGEIRLSSVGLDWDWTGKDRPNDENISRIAQFIEGYSEPELADYLD